jgi:hypothetical protein
VVIRVLAGLVAAAMLLASGPGVPWHVHEYWGHDHADHRHGPAAHSHTADADRHGGTFSADHGPAIESCDPGEHAVSVVFEFVGCDTQRAPLAVVFATVRMTPPDVAGLSAAPSDVRAHGPPQVAAAPLRAPPLVHLA